MQLIALPRIATVQPFETVAMLNRRDRIERLDNAIAESEQRITEQLFLIMTKEAMGEDTAVAKRALKALQGIYVEYRRARKLFAEATRAIDPPSAP